MPTMRPLLALIAAVGLLPAADRFVDQRSPAADDGGPGTAERPFRSIAAALRDLHAGDTVRVRGGTYREAVEISADGTADAPIALVAEPGPPVVLTGADVLAGLTRSEDGRWSVAWDQAFEGPHPDDPYHRLVGRAEQVFVDRYPLTQVAAPEQVVPGTFCADLAAKRLWLRPLAGRDLGDAGNRVEASVRPLLLRVTGQHVHVRGLDLRFAANIAQHGLADFAGAHALVEDCVFERANGSGASFHAPDIEVRRCVFRDNGQLGFGASGCDRLHLVGCAVTGNNTKDFGRGWEAGGLKCCMSRGVVFERSRFERNRGVGVWFDIGNEDATVRQCLIADNEDAGVFYEISFGLHAHDDVVIGNGLVDSAGAWAADGGIALSSSPGCVIERNLILGNKEGVQFREQGRTTPRIGKPGPEQPVWNHDETVRANLIALNRDAQLRGWFDVADQRMWPAAMRPAGEDAKRPAAGNADAYVAKDAAAPATSLEGLALAIDGDAYLAAPGHGLVVWGCEWKRHVAYPTLPELSRDLAFEARGVALADLPFADPLARDFRLPADHPALKAGCYPRGEVPGVRLGAISAGR